MSIVNRMIALDQATITFTAEMRDSFRLQHKAAIEQNINPFLFDGNKYDIGYAKYLLEYLDMRFEG